MKRSYLLILILLFGLGVFFRTYRLTTAPPGLYPDEAMDGNDALHANRTGIYRVFYPEDTGREGLFINAQAMALKVSGVRAPWVLRSVSAVFGSLTIIGLYFLASELFSPSVGLWAAFFMATGFWHIVFSRIAFRAISAPFWLVWSVYFLLVGYRKIRSGAPFSKTAIWHVLGGLFFGLGFHSYISYRTMPLLALLILSYYWIVAREEQWLDKFFKASLLFLVSSFMAVLPLLLYFLHTPGAFFERVSAVSILRSPHLVSILISNSLKMILMFTFFGDMNWRHNYSGRPVLSGLVGALFVVGVVSSLLAFNYLWKAIRHHLGHEDPFLFEDPQVRKGFSYALVWTWLALGAIPVVLSDASPHSLRSLLMSPMAYTLAAVGAASVYQYLKARLRPSTLTFGVILFALVLSGETYNLYFRMWVPSPNVYIALTGDYLDVAHQINSLPDSTPKYVIFPQGNHEFDLLDGIPLSAQTIMFITDTFEIEEREQKNVHYVIEGEEGDIPENAQVFRMRGPI